MTQTGRSRCRVQKYTGKLILQIEFAYTRSTDCGGMIDSEPATVWRDAKLEDIISWPAKNDVCALG